MDCSTKLEAITDETLVAGIDVAQDTHVARVFDHRGAELCGRIVFQNTREGIDSFIRGIESQKALHGKKDAIIGLEPTGVYGHALISYLQKSGYNVVYILGMQVRRAKELEDNSPSKNDHKDAKVIASLVKDGYYRKIRVFADDIAELRDATGLAYQTTKKLTRVQCQLKGCLAQYFPEFRQAFKDVSKKTAMATLRLFPLPEQLGGLSAEQIVAAWRASGVIKGIGLKKAAQLKRLAMDTIGVKATESVRIKFRRLMAEYDLLLSQEKEVWRRIYALLEGNKDFDAIMGIPYMTPRLAAYLLAEVGDFRDFDHPQQVVRLAGLSLKESSSGKNRGRSEITRRGRPRLRRTLYFIVLEQLKHAAPGWHQLHRRYTTRKDNPLKKMQSVTALCCRFLRVVWGMLDKGTPYDPELAFPKKTAARTA
jgi:transposase